MFEVGSRVGWCGIEGVVVRIDAGSEYPLLVRFNQHVSWFTLDGKHQTWHTEPSLKLISRPKKKVKVYRHYWMYNHDVHESQLSVYVGFETWEEFATESMILWRTEELFECDGPRGGE